MPGVLNLRDVLQPVVDSLNDSPLAQQNLVLRAHEHVPHVVAHSCDELYSVNEEHLEKSLADISPVSAELALDIPDVALVPERVAVVGVARGNHEVEYLSAVIDDQVQLEAAEAPGVEQDEYDHYLRIAHAVELVPAVFAVIPSVLE